MECRGPAWAPSIILAKVRPGFRPAPMALGSRSAPDALLPVERLATIEVGATMIRPVFGVMLIIVCVEAAVRGRPVLGAMRFWHWGWPPFVVLPHRYLAPLGGLRCVVLFSNLHAGRDRSISVDAAGSYWSLWQSGGELLVACCRHSVALAASRTRSCVFIRRSHSRVHALTLEPSYLAPNLLPHVFRAHQLGRRRTILIVIALFVHEPARYRWSNSRHGRLLLLDPSRRRHAASFVLGPFAVAAVALTLLVAVGAGSAYAGFMRVPLTPQKQFHSPRLESWTQA